MEAHLNLPPVLLPVHLLRRPGIRNPPLRTTRIDVDCRTGILESRRRSSYDYSRRRYSATALDSRRRSSYSSDSETATAIPEEGDTASYTSRRKSSHYADSRRKSSYSYYADSRRSSSYSYYADSRRRSLDYSRRRSLYYTDTSIKETDDPSQLVTAIEDAPSPSYGDIFEMLSGSGSPPLCANMVLLLLGVLWGHSCQVQ